MRPYITYNEQRLQLGVYEKEHWLRRYLSGHTVVIPQDIMNKVTTLTFGEDVAIRIGKLALDSESIGQVYNVSNPYSILWQDVLELYDKCLYTLTGKRLKIIYKEDSTELQGVWNKYQIIYDRLYSRQFDNTKQEIICGTVYSNIEDALMHCLHECINAPSYAPNKIRGAYEGWSDKVAGELTPLHTIPGRKNKLRYIKKRISG